MNKTKNYLGLLALLPLFSVAFVSVTFDEAFAVGGLGIAEAEERANPTIAEPDVDLELKQTSEPTKADTSTKTTKGFTPKTVEDNAESYRVVYQVLSFGKDNVKNVEIQIESDIGSVTEKILGNWDIKRSSISVVIKALDPNSINAELIGYQVA